MNIVDYYVTGRGVIERGLFLNYMKNKGYKIVGFSREDMLNSYYPIGICIKSKKIILIGSAALCYFASRGGKIKSIEEIKDILA